MNKHIFKTITQLSVAILLLAIHITSFAQTTGEDTESKKGWNFLVEPYIMFPNMKGDIGVGQLPNAEVDEDPSDIFDNLQFGAMLNFEAYNDQWTITSDFIYMKLESEVAQEIDILSGKAEVEQLGWELAVMRKLLPWLEAGIGGQLNSVDSELRLTLDTGAGTQEGRLGLDETWVDPTIIGRVKYPLSDKWLFLFRGNIGGFGISSDFSWQIQSHLTYSVSELFKISAGYRWIGVDYEDGSGQDRFLYDINTFGAVIRLGFNF